jgi:hypothetical protein
MQMKSATDKPSAVISTKRLSITRLMSAFVCLGFLVAASVTTINYADGNCMQDDILLKTATHSSANINCIAQDKSVSWITWITNKSASNQFHFLDLLELLSRSSSEGKE